jgi:hypothetical protein
MSDYDADLLARTILGEAANQGDVGQAAVAHVVKNRLASGRYGKTLEDVLFAPKQFEPWNTRRNELMGYGDHTPGFGDAKVLARAVLDGRIEDPTDGATHFANVGTVQQRGNTRALGWIDRMFQNGSARKIGAHTFGRADGEGASGGGRAPSLRYGTQTGGRNAGGGGGGPMSPHQMQVRQLIAELLADDDIAPLLAPVGGPAPPAVEAGGPAEAPSPALQPPPAPPPMPAPAPQQLAQAEPAPHAPNPWDMPA